MPNHDPGHHRRMRLDQLRREYRHAGLRRSDLAMDPLSQFDRWMQEAIDAEIPDPTAMQLATISPAGQPHCRTVLLKGRPDEGFVFYTRYSTEKGDDIATNPRVALTFYWHAFDRQVHIHGRCEKLATRTNHEYFASRPRGAQLAAWAAIHKRMIPGREVLEQAYDYASQRFADGPIDCPPDWGGYLVRPQCIEFWQGRENRLHDRFRYTDGGGHWTVDRLAP